MSRGTCTVGDCERVHQAKGMCRMHYSRKWKASQPRKPRPKLAPLEDRLPRMVKVSPFGCWSWLLATDKDGYGHYKLAPYRTQVAHRIVRKREAEQRTAGSEETGPGRAWRQTSIRQAHRS